MEAEGIEPAKRYYDKHGVTFPALVDPHFATGFGYVPWTFFVDEHGVVRGKGDDWEKLIKPAGELKAVTPRVLSQWSDSKNRLTREAMVALEEEQKAHPGDLSLTTELASRYLVLGETVQSKSILEKAIQGHDATQIARSGGKNQRALLSRAYLQLSRAEAGNREAQLSAARTAYFLAPSIGLAKQISRIADPSKFDGRPDGKLDNRYRNEYAKKIRSDREVWLQQTD